MLIGKIDVTNDKVIEDSIVSNKESYNVDDCCLVRTTDHFPFGGKIYTPLNAYALNREYPSGFKYILLDIDIPSIELNLLFKLKLLIMLNELLVLSIFNVNQ